MSSLVMSHAERMAAERLIDLAIPEDLGDRGDLTTLALISADEWATVRVVARESGVFAGGPILSAVFARLDRQVEVRQRVPDGSAVTRGVVVAEVQGPLRALLTGERTALNFLLRMSGVASATARFVDLVAGTRAGIFDTRKTLPGWRLLDKYAVRAGGGRNHRVGLYDQILIKDNHLAGWEASGPGHTIPQAIELARRAFPGVVLEVEVDTLEQLAGALTARPEMVLLDNMTCEQLHQGVLMRNELAPGVELEASGGVTLETVAAIARTGVERISVGGLTHSSPALDLAFDWGSAGHRPDVG